MVESNDERNFDKAYKRVVDYEKGGGNELKAVCYDIGVMRKVLGMMNGELIGCKVGS